MPKQEFDSIDYLGPVVVAIAFALLLLLLSFFLLNLVFIRKDDEITVFEKFGLKHNIRLGPHSLRAIKLIHQNGIIAYNTDNEKDKNVCTTSTDAGYLKHPIPMVKVDAASITNEATDNP
uniref:Uncharacterized protein n=1 Tax=Ditylenchus dipsaci TaxID=166011 RepID=A0A915DH77_9BILA